MEKYNHDVIEFNMAAVHLKEQQKKWIWGGRDGVRMNYNLNCDMLVIKFQDINYEVLSQDLVVASVQITKLSWIANYIVSCPIAQLAEHLTRDLAPGLNLGLVLHPPPQIWYHLGSYMYL